MQVSGASNVQYSVKAFHDNLGFQKYPFNVCTAENERPYASKIFVHPENYDSVKEAFDDHLSIIVRGNRGTGKTALLSDLQQHIDSNHIYCIIEDYSVLPLQPTTHDYYDLIITNLVSSLFNRLFEEKKRLKKLDKEDKLFLSAMLSQYTTSVTKRELTRKIEKVQLSGVKRFFKDKINLVRAVLNYGVTIGTNIVNDIIRNYYSYLPPVTEDQIHDILPKIQFDAETNFNAIDSSYTTLLQLCAVIENLGYEHPVIFFDKFDEDSRMENDAEIIATFISPLLVDNKLLENEQIQLIISVWEVPFDRITGVVRTQKHYCPELSWPIPYLKDVLNKRLNVFSNSKVQSFEDLFDSSLTKETSDQIFNLSNGNPRDLWHILDYIIKAQYSIDPLQPRLQLEAVQKGIYNFVTQFNFYEYYPKKPNAKANTMDVYGYIKHLLKLTSIEFTKNQLNDCAKTGSSTSNYVVGMEHIGLVSNTQKKHNGGVIYRINDPKVVYAIENGIEISR